MPANKFVVVTDRGGHLHNALMLLDQMGVVPDAMVTTFGPDIDALGKRFNEIHVVPYLFTWIGKQRIWNPISALYHFWVSFRLALKLRPKSVVSLGASNVVLFCYWARVFGARIIHVECMNQVVNTSVTGRMLYPIAEKVYVQWEDLLPKYGPKAQYAGWVL